MKRLLLLSCAWLTVLIAVAFTCVLGWEFTLFANAKDVALIVALGLNLCIDLFFGGAAVWVAAQLFVVAREFKEDRNA